jgi:hypothetical protein
MWGLLGCPLKCRADEQSISPYLCCLSSNRVDERFGSFDAKNQFVNFFWNFVYFAVGDSYDSSVWTPFPKLSNQLAPPQVSN